jgi:predicted DNA-binding protein with PD1-like motif
MKFIFIFIFSALSMSQAISQTSDPWSALKATAVRLKPHQDLKKELIAFAKENKIKAGLIITCVGSLEQVNLRFANQETGTLLKGHFEILALVGTFSDSSSHLHLSVADSEGKTFGGHLLDESLIYTTAEIVIGELTEKEFDRTLDTTYGYKELLVKPRSQKKN